jgi:hypothetical protein
MLHDFLLTNRGTILALTRSKAVQIAQDKPTTEALESGLPAFYDHLIGVLRTQARRGSKILPTHYAPATRQHGKEALRLGYSISQVVHGYGVICQAITETAETLGVGITPGEFSTLNLSLDVAIAEAVTAYSKPAPDEEKRDSTERIGFLVHELRNALACAIVANTMVKQGLVGVGGSTSALLERNLLRMRDLLDRSFSEIRLQNEPGAVRRPLLLASVVEEVATTAREEARSKGIYLALEGDPGVLVHADRNFLVSALANLVQNAIKFTKVGGSVTVRTLEAGETVIVEVEDRCGGLPPGKAEELFQPFTQKGPDKTGLGLGLSISRRAIALNEGLLAVRDLPGVGCVFFITLPKIASKEPAR